VVEKQLLEQVCSTALLERRSLVQQFLELRVTLKLTGTVFSAACEIEV